MSLVHRLEVPRTEDGSSRFSVASYNVLAQKWVDDGISLYETCPSECKTFEHRHALILDQIQSMHADIVCLQECDFDTVARDFGEPLSKMGYELCRQDAKTKAANHTTCNATFYKTSKFRLQWAESRSRVLITAFESVDIDQATIPCMENFKIVPEDAVLSDEDIKETSNSTTEHKHSQCHHDDSKKNNKHNTNKNKNKNTRKRKKVKPIKWPKSTPPLLTYVANCHLQGDPKAGDMRVQQIVKLMRRTAAQHQHHNVRHETFQESAMIVTGDFNSTPKGTVYELLTAGSLSANAQEYGCTVTKKDISLPGSMKMGSAYGDSKHGEPACTFCVKGFLIDALDFVFYNKDSLEVEAVMQVADDMDSVLQTYLPSATHGSDHLPVCAVFRRKTSFTQKLRSYYAKLQQGHIKSVLMSRRAETEKQQKIAELAAKAAEQESATTDETAAAAAAESESESDANVNTIRTVSDSLSEVDASALVLS
jgi:mRNA deadenylase 3'-5' endonuclease subunit Ccr4